jgi:hypothetical protein
MNFDKLTYHKSNIDSFIEDLRNELDRPQVDIIRYDKLHSMLKMLTELKSRTRDIQKIYYTI